MFFYFLFSKPNYQIKIEGNKRIEREAILNYISDDVFTDSEALNMALKKLYETDYFKDVKLDLKDNVLIIQVVEQPVINEIIFQGNKKVSSDTLKQQLGISSGQSFSEFKILGEASQKIEAVYRMMGLMNTKVIVKKEFVKKPQDQSLDKSRVNVTFKIIEGSLAFIKSVKFIGNKSFNDVILLANIESKIYSGFKFWSQNHYFFQERLQQDYIKLQEFYQNNGYPDAVVTSYSSELKFDKTGFDLVFSIKEGGYYTFGDVTIDYQHPQKVNLEKLKSFLPIKSGAKFSMSLLRETEDLIADDLGRQHISTAEVSIEPIKKKSTFDIKVTVKKTAMNKVRFIHVKGNRKTYEKVILDNLIIKEGSFFSRHKLRQSEYNLYRLSFFDRVKLTPKEVGKNLYDIDVSIEESGKSGTTSFNIQYSTYEGLGLNIQFIRPNIGGTGNAVQGAAICAWHSQQINFNFMSPRLWDVPDLSGGVGVSFERSTQWNEREVWQLSASGNVNYQLNRYFSQGIECKVGIDSMYLIQNTKLSGLKSWLFKSNKKISNSFVFGPADKDKGEISLGLDKDVVEKATWNYANENERKKRLSGGEDKVIQDIAAMPKEDGEESTKTKQINQDLIGKPKTASTTVNMNDPRPVYDVSDMMGDFESLDASKIQSLRDLHFQEELKLRLWKEDIGTKGYASFTHSLSFSPFIYNPNRKFSFSMSMRNSISVGQVRYHKHDFSIKHIYFLPFHHIKLKTTGTVGVIRGGQDLRIQDCMSLSGHQVHGFAQWGIGPRDKWTKEPLHGKNYYFGGVEFKIPLFPTSEIGINVGGYVNFGNVWGSKFIGHDEIDRFDRIQDGNIHTIRSSIGFFVSFRFPNFPIRFDFAKGFGEKYDIKEVFMIGIDM